MGLRRFYLPYNFYFIIITITVFFPVLIRIVFLLIIFCDISHRLHDSYKLREFIGARI